MSEHRGLGGREGPELLVYLAREYLPSLKPQAAAALLGAYTDDPRSFEDPLEQFVAQAHVPALAEAGGAP